MLEPLSPAIVEKSATEIPEALVVEGVPSKRPAPASLQVTVTPRTGLPKRSVTIPLSDFTPPAVRDSEAEPTARKRASTGKFV